MIKPATPGDLSWVKAHYDSVYGRIESHWTFDHGKFTIGVAIPPNTTAVVCVPTKAGTGVLESGKPAAQATGVKYLRWENGAGMYEVGSGRYNFSVE